jgi:hypothetical protein
MVLCNYVYFLFLMERISQFGPQQNTDKVDLSAHFGRMRLA